MVRAQLPHLLYADCTPMQRRVYLIDGTEAIKLVRGVDCASMQALPMGGHQLVSRTEGRPRKANIKEQCGVIL
jgi:hypothetical protein